MQWISEARDFEFPQTSGSFISFKDAEIPIQNYFMENYDELVRIKKKVDPTCFFGSATTIK
ncbi:MAG: BBE domain-containing protein [Lewinella sp.]